MFLSLISANYNPFSSPFSRLPLIKGTDVPLLSLASWPSAEDLELDDSQFRALQMALTKEFAVIQGPPGTGKTYIGLKVD